MKKNALLIGNLVKHAELTHLIRIMRTTFFDFCSCIPYGCNRSRCPESEDQYIRE